MVEKIKIILGLVIILGGFGFLFYLSAVGMISEDIAIRVRFKEPRNMVFEGYPKILICLSGLMISLAMLSLPFMGVINRKFEYKASNKRRTKWFEEKVWVPTVALAFTGVITAFIWQSINLPVYR